MNSTTLAKSLAARAPRVPTPIAPASAIVLGLLASSCLKGNPAPITSGASAGTLLAQPDPSIGSRSFIVDSNQGGQASSVRVRGLYWGRLVDVRDSSGTHQNTGMVIGEDIQSDNINYLLDTNAITEVTTVTILYAAGTPQYADAFKRLDQNLASVTDKNLSPSTLPPFTLVPRNSAIVVKFDDLMDSSTIQFKTVQIVTGYPAVTPFEYRAIPDINHGDLYDADGDGELEFHTTRAILDLTVSEVDLAQTSTPVPINNLGLPGSLNTSQANVGVRIPTHRDASIGQTTLVTNLSGKSLSFTENGSNDPNSPTDDIVRAVRSGGKTSVTSDANNGFLVDQVSPKVVGVQPVQISTPVEVQPGEFVSAMDYAMDFCASRPKLGDVIQQPPNIYAEVVLGSGNVVGGTVDEVHFRIVSPAGAQLSAGPAQVYSVWNPVANFGKSGCFVRYSGLSASSGANPGQGVPGDGQVIMRFSEPMDPTTLTAFDNMPVLRVDPAIAAPTAREFVIGAVGTSADLKEFAFKPVIEYKHTFGSATDRFWVSLGSGATGPTDLSGRPLSDLLPVVSFTIDPNAATANNGGMVFRFNSDDELLADGLTEWRGQTTRDLTTATIQPRPVTRRRATCDRSTPVPGAMTAFPTGLQTPLSSLGSKMQALWRYCDVGLGIVDESSINVDVEHIYWAPAGGNVVSDTFRQFEIRLSHTKVLPDESVNPLTGAPIYPNSGLFDTFDDNLLSITNDPQEVVHDKSLGYVVDPANRKTAASGSSTVMPFPLNQGIPVAQYKYYTWRDTALLDKGAVDSAMPGAEVPRAVAITGIGIEACPFTNFYGQNPAPSVAMPLLMEFRCYPDNGALGLNSLDVNLAVNGFARPNFRAYSTGGTNSSGQTVTINPDTELSAHGGFNPTSVPPGGATLSSDNTLYLGEMDLVTRVSRMYSVWFDSQVNSPTYLPPVIEPRPGEQPSGTSIEIAYRAATAVLPVAGGINKDATFIDYYGNPILCPVTPGPPPSSQCTLITCITNGNPTFFRGDRTWKATITDINTAKFFQTRVTFVSNTDTSLTPTLSSLGFAFRQ